MSFTNDPDVAPGSPGHPLTLTDVEMIRALAHPARIVILQHLALEGPATATECAEVAGLSPSACSYHLRTLARHGFVEEDPDATADGRQRPWRARIISVSVGDDPGQPEAVRAAGRLLQDSLDARVAQIRAQYLERQAAYPADWQAAGGSTQDVLHLTAGELESLRAELGDLLARYRRLDPAQRPAGSSRVHAFLEFLPWFEPDATS
jgi:DNA-binding transcriptional ArsR family regulator